MVEEGKHKRHSKEDVAKKAGNRAEWTVRKKEEQRQRVDKVKHMIQHLGESRRSGNGRKLKEMQNAVQAVVQIIDDVEKMDQTLEQVAKKVGELEREEEDAKQMEQQSQEQAAREPRPKSILKFEARGQSCPSLEKRAEVSENVPKEQVETVVSIVVEAVQKVVGEVMHNVIEKMVTDEKMMIQDDYMVADVVEKLGQMMKGDGDKLMERQTVSDRLLEMEEWEEESTEVSSLEGPEMTRLERPEIASFQGPEMTGLEGPKVTGLKGPKATGLKGPKATGLEGPKATGLKGPKATSLKGPKATSLKGPKATGFKGPKVTSLERPEMTQQWGPEVTGYETLRQELFEEAPKGMVKWVAQDFVGIVTKEPVEEAASEPGEEATVEPGEEATLEPGEEATLEPGEEATLEPEEEATMEPEEEATLEPGEEATLEPGEEATLEPGEEATQEPGEEAALEPGEEATLEPEEEATLEPGEEATLEPGEEATLEPGEEATLEPEEEALQESVGETMRQPVKQPPKEPVEQAPKKAGNQAAKGPAEGDIKLAEVEQPVVEAATNEIEALHQVYDILIDMTAGSFDITAFEAILGALNFKMSTVDILQTFQYMDVDTDGTVSFEDFLEVMTNDDTFAQFIADLPDLCSDSKVQKGYVDDRVFFIVLSSLLQSQSLSENTATTIVDYYYRKKKGAKLRSKKTDGSELMAKTFMGVSVYSLIQYLDILEPEEDYQEIQPTPEQTEAFSEVFQFFDRTSEGHIEVTGLLNTMNRLAIGLDNPFIPDAAKFDSVNSGTEVSFQDFVRIMADTDTFGEFLNPQEPECGSHMPPETLPFEILLENMHSSVIHPESRTIIVNYYQTKYRRLGPQILDRSNQWDSGTGEKSSPEGAPTKAAGDRKTEQVEARLAGARKVEQLEAKPAKHKAAARPRASRPAGDAKSPAPGGEHKATVRKQPGSAGPRPKQVSTSSQTLQRQGRPQHPKGPTPDRQKKTPPPKEGQAVPASLTDNIRTYRQQCVNSSPSPAPKPKKRKGKEPSVDNGAVRPPHSTRIVAAAK